MRAVTAILWLTLAASMGADERLPPKELRADWQQFKEFTDLNIEAFTGWDTPFDGGSKVFFFRSTTGIVFDVVAANPAYWTDADKKARRQVFYVIRKRRFHRLDPGSAQEKALIRMLEKARPRLEGSERTDPKLLDSLLARLRDRRPMFDLDPSG